MKNCNSSILSRPYHSDIRRNMARKQPESMGPPNESRLQLDRSLYGINIYTEMTSMGMDPVHGMTRIQKLRTRISEWPKLYEELNPLNRGRTPSYSIPNKRTLKHPHFLPPLHAIPCKSSRLARKQSNNIYRPTKRVYVWNTI